MKKRQLSGTVSWKNFFSIILLTIVLTEGQFIKNAQAQELSSLQLAQSLDQDELKELQEKANNFINLWSQGELVQARENLAPALQSVLSLEQMKLKWQQLEAKAGKFKKIVKSRSIDIVNAVLVLVTVEFEKTTEQLVVNFNKDEEIVGVDFPKTDPIQTIAEQFVDSLATGDYVNARGDLDSRLKTELFPEDLKRKWEGLQKLTGPFEKIVKSEVKQRPGSEPVDLVLVTIEFANFTDEMVVIFNAQKRIVGVDFPVIDD